MSPWLVAVLTLAGLVVLTVLVKLAVDWDYYRAPPPPRGRPRPPL